MQTTQHVQLVWAHTNPVADVGQRYSYTCTCDIYVQCSAFCVVAGLCLSHLMQLRPPGLASYLLSERVRFPVPPPPTHMPLVAGVASRIPSHTSDSRLSDRVRNAKGSRATGPHARWDGPDRDSEVHIRRTRHMRQDQARWTRAAVGEAVGKEGEIVELKGWECDRVKERGGYSGKRLAA
jgi:hypothetical protein